MSDTPTPKLSEVERLLARQKEIAVKLAQARVLQQRRESAKVAAQKKAERRAIRKLLNADRRAEDAHKKVVLGGLLIAVGADQYNEAEIAGLLLEVLPNITDANRERFRIAGATHLKARAEAVGRTWKQQWDGKNVLLDIDRTKSTSRKPNSTKSEKTVASTPATPAATQSNSA